jgi:two-component system chemotaxis response regulator CheY
MDHGLEGLKVLIVDDNQHMRAIVAAILKSANVLNVREATDGGHALSILRNWPADIAIVDFQMAPMDGLELTRKLRDPAVSSNPYLPIIMMTGYAERQRVMEARDAGVSEFLVKPVTAKGVLDRLHAAVFKPRPFVKNDAYFGPTRRRVDLPDRPGPRRRAEDANKAGEA